MSGALRTAAFIPAVAAAAVTACVFGSDADAPAEEALQCVTGDAAVNPTATLDNGRTVAEPVTEELDTVAEAENYLCLNIPHPRDLDGWEVQYVFASRPQSLDAYETDGGIGNRRLMVAYSHETLAGGVELTVHSPGANNPAAAGSEEVSLNGVSAVLASEGDQFCYLWEADGFGFSACGGGEVTADDARTLLESTE